MRITAGFHGREQAVADLFAATFAASEGPDEGALIGRLARDLMASTPAADIRVMVAEDDDAPIGAAILTRLAYAQDARVVFIVAPVAVATDRQGRGVGARLLTEALDSLRAEGVNVALVYGDPAYYARVGFAPVDVATAPPPLPLQHPEGWLGQSLTGAAIAPLKGPPRCVAALDDPAFW